MRFDLLCMSKLQVVIELLVRNHIFVPKKTTHGRAKNYSTPLSATQYQSSTQLPQGQIGLKFDAGSEFNTHLGQKQSDPRLKTTTKLIFVPPAITHTVNFILKFRLSKLTFLDRPVLYSCCPWNLDAIWSTLHSKTQSGHGVIAT